MQDAGGKRQGANVQSPISIFQLLTSSLCLGALAVINTWDLPTYLGLTAVAFLLQERLIRGRWKLARPAILTILVGGLSLLLYRPFFAYYKALYVGLGLAITRGRTDLGSSSPCGAFSCSSSSPSCW
jgi:uncharacterized membrane protein